jgi:hypothetical protein
VVELLVVLVVVVLVVALLVVVGSSDVELVVEVDVGTSEVVDVEMPHSVQQLPSVAVPPRASQRSVELKTRQRCDPVDVVHRHATRPVVPHADFAAHRTTAPLQGAGSASAATSAFAAYDTHAM